MNRNIMTKSILSMPNILASAFASEILSAPFSKSDNVLDAKIPTGEYVVDALGKVEDNEICVLIDALGNADGETVGEYVVDVVSLLLGRYVGADDICVVIDVTTNVDGGIVTIGLYVGVSVSDSDVEGDCDGFEDAVFVGFLLVGDEVGDLDGEDEGGMDVALDGAADGDAVGS